MAVIVHEMVPAASAGVLFTTNPVSGDRSEILLNSSWGLGESVVLGSVEPDTFIIDKESGEVKTRNISDKRTMIAPLGKAGTGADSVPAHLRTQPSIRQDQLAQLHDIGLSIEEIYEAPQDIEWCYEGDSLYVVQSRPITGLDPFPIAWEHPDDKAHQWALAADTRLGPLLPPSPVVPQATNLFYSHRFVSLGFQCTLVAL